MWAHYTFVLLTADGVETEKFVSWKSQKKLSLNSIPVQIYGLWEHKVPVVISLFFLLVLTPFHLLWIY